MQAVLSTFGGRGDVEPLVALAVELRREAVEVRMCAPPDEDFAQRLAGIGVELVAVGPSARELVKAPPKPSSIPEAAAMIIASQFEVMPAAVAGADVLLATGALPAAAGALSVAELQGVPAISLTFQQLTLPSPDRKPLAYRGRPLPPDVTDNRALWAFDDETIEQLFSEALNGNRRANGLPAVEHVRAYVVTEHPWVATDPVLDPLDDMPGLDVVQTGAWLAADDRALPPDLLAFLDAGAPPVFAGFGSMPMHGTEDPGEVVVEAIRANGRRAVVGRGWADLAAADDRDDCFVVGDVNHHALFPRMAAVIHHGGAGTTVTASRSGRPQVVVPQSVDQPYWAGRVAALGIGSAHDGPVPTVASLSQALAAALQPGTQERAAAVAGQIRADGAANAARRLIDAFGGATTLR